jgi:Tol biopolymer transport system component
MRGVQRLRPPLALSLLALCAALLWPAGSAVAAPSGTIVFQGNRESKRFIYTMNADGSGVKKLGDGFEPSVSRDGKTIVFCRTVGRDVEIFTMNAAGGNVEQVTHDHSLDIEPALSADGKRIVFIGDRRNDDPEGEPPHIFVVDTNGSHEQQVTKGRFNDYEPSFSPDGKRIAFVRGPGVTELMTIGDDGDDPTVLDITKYPFTGPKNPSYSPDGRRILFQAFQTNGKNRVYTIDAGGGGLDLVNKGDNQGVEPAFSPDGDTIVYRLGVNLLTMGLDGQDITPLTDLQPQEGSNIHASWGR